MEEGWRRLHNEELNNLHTLPNIIRVINSRRMRLTGHIACMGKMRNALNFSMENLRGINYSEGLGADGRILD